MLQHNASTTTDIWRQFTGLATLLDVNDDDELWQIAIGQIIADAQHLIIQAANKKLALYAEIGRCSHWLRPHQTRWTGDGGFAAPLGYDGSGYSRRGLPEFDWSLKWQWKPQENQWVQTEKPLGRRRLQFRVAIPSRTMQHNQAAVHTIWTPGAPTMPDEKSVQFYGFRKQQTSWQLTAHWSNKDSLSDANTTTRSPS